MTPNSQQEMCNLQPGFHILAKPTGSICNLDCKYCYFLSKEMLYPGSQFRMADEMLETYIRQAIQEAFFHHLDRPTKIVAELLRRDRTPAEVMQILSAEESRLKSTKVGAGRNDPCPCGSGRKYSSSALERHSK